jgi:hypothetical protein
MLYSYLPLRAATHRASTEMVPRDSERAIVHGRSHAPANDRIASVTAYALLMYHWLSYALSLGCLQDTNLKRKPSRV